MSHSIRDWDDEQHLHELKHTLANHIMLTTNVEADASRLEDDVWVEGPLSEIFAWSYDWRSEIEELG